jgi:hypothetical protein
MKDDTWRKLKGFAATSQLNKTKPKMNILGRIEHLSLTSTEVPNEFFRSDI